MLNKNNIDNNLFVNSVGKVKKLRTAEQHRESKGCGTKVSYPSLESAEKSRSNLIRKFKTTDVKPYRCKFCELYHLGRPQFD